MPAKAQRNGVLAGGNFIIDSVKMIDHWPQQDTLCSVLCKSRSNGGGPYNILKNLAKLAPDLPLEACGLLGLDADAQWVLEDCGGSGINTDQLICRAGAQTSVTDAMTDVSTGRRTFFHARGANAELSVADFDFKRSNAKIFSLGYLMLLDQLDLVDPLDEITSTGAARLLAAARAEGMITAVDTVSASHPHFREISLAALKHADIFFVNEIEAGWILDRAVNAGNIDQSVRDLADLGSTGTVVLHMPELAVAYSIVDDELVRQMAVDFPAGKIVGATGAGDAFAAGYLYGRHQDWSIQECLKCAVCVAAMSLTHSTPSAGILSVRECLMLAQSFGYKD